MSESEAAARRADSPRRRARAAASSASGPAGGGEAYRGEGADLAAQGPVSWAIAGGASQGQGYPYQDHAAHPADQGYGDQSYGDQSYASQGYDAYAADGYAADGYAAQDYAAYSGDGYADQGYTGQGYADQGYADQGYADQGYATQGHASQGYGDQDLSGRPGGEHAGEGYGAGPVPGPTSSPYGVPVGSGQGGPGDRSSAGFGSSPYADVLGQAPRTSPGPVPAQAAPPSPVSGSRIAPPEIPDSEVWLGASAPPRRAVPSSGTDSTRRRSAGERRDGRFGLGRLWRRDGAAERSKPETPMQAVLSAATEVVVVLVMALGLSLLIKTFFVQAFFIPSQSMEDTLEIGDRVLVSKLTPGPFTLHRGDVVVFKDPGGWLDEQPPRSQSAIRHGLTVALTFVGLLPQDSGEHLIKRVIGLPGDTVSCDGTGKVKVNGVPVDETYLKDGNKPSSVAFTVTVQPGYLWVMGDNRADSFDSRFHRSKFDGQVPMTNVVGKAFTVVWPFDHAGGVNEPSSVFARVPAASA